MLTLPQSPCQLHATETGAPRCRHANGCDAAVRAQLVNFFQYLAGFVLPQGRFDVFGCCVAEGEKGKKLLRYLRKRTGFEWAGSTNLTGTGPNVKDGFDYDLETVGVSHAIQLPCHCHFCQVTANPHWDETATLLSSAMNRLLKRLPPCALQSIGVDTKYFSRSMLARWKHEAANGDRTYCPSTTIVLLSLLPSALKVSCPLLCVAGQLIAGPGKGNTSDCGTDSSCNDSDYDD